MLLTYVPREGGKFLITSASLGLTDKDIQAMRDRPVATHQDDFILKTVHDACQRLELIQPAGSC